MSDANYVVTPAGWIRRRVDSFISLTNGFAFKPRHWKKSGLPIIRIQNLNRPDAPFNYCDEILPEKFTVCENDLLFAWSGTPGTSFGAHIWRGGKALLNQHIFRVVFDREKIDLRFLRYSINQNLDSYIRAAHGGAGLAHITKGVFEASELLIAPLPEQQRIVAKIEELFSDLDAGVAALERVRAKLKRYRASVLNAAVTGKLTEGWRKQNPPAESADKLLSRILDERRETWEAEQTRKFADAARTPPKGWREKYETPVAPTLNDPKLLPSGWALTTLSGIGFVDRGRSRNRPRDAAHLYGGPYPFIQTGDIGRAKTFVTSYSQTYSEAGLAQSRLWPRGTLCITIAANIAETAILGIDACFPDSVVGFRESSDRVSVRYVEIYLRTVQKRIEALAPATAQKNINNDTLRQVEVFLPPRAEQDAIVADVDRRLSVVDAIEAEIEQGLKRAARLRQAILKRAFEGKVVPQIAGEVADVVAAPIIPIATTRRGRIKRQPKPVKRKHRKGIAFDRAAVMARIIHRIGHSKNFGRTEAMKTLYLAEALLGIDLEFEPVREKLGPLDGAIYGIENLARKQGWFFTKKSGPMIRYTDGPAIADRLRAAERIIGDKLMEFDRLLDEIEKMDTEQAELFATTFAVWNDRFIEKMPADNTAIVAGVHGWHPSKIQKFPSGRINACIQWMKDNHFVPEGRGPRAITIEDRNEDSGPSQTK